MWRKVKENLESGIEKIRWFSTLLNERIKVEISLFRLLHRSAEMEKKRAALMKTIGEKVYELRHASDRQLLRDPVIIEAMTGLDGIEAEMEEVRKKAAELGKIEA